MRCEKFMDSVTDFLAMGRYGAYVWPSYALAVVVMAGLWLSTVARLRKNETLLKDIEQNQRRQG